MTSTELRPASAERRALVLGPALTGPLILVGIAALTTYAGLTDSLPKVFSMLVAAGLLVYAVERAPEWIVAILLVGQFILHWISSFGGEIISRDNPLGGPLLPMYILAGCLVVLRVMMIRQKRARPPWPVAAQIIMVSAALLGASIAAGLLYSPAPMAARTKMLGYFVFNLAPSVLAVMLIDTEEQLVRLVKAVIVIGTLMAVFTHLGHGAEESGAGAGLYNIGVGKYGIGIGGARFAGGTWFARRLDLVLVSLLALVALSRSKLPLAALLIVAPYIAYLLFLSGARGATAGGALAFMVVLTLLTAVARSGRAIRSAVVVVLLLVFALGMSNVREELETPEIVYRYSVLQRPLAEEGSGSDRIQFWRSAWETFLDHPAFGIGAGGWGMVWDKQDVRDFPHNVFLEILCEEGLIGGFLFALFFFGTVRLVWKVMRHPLSTPRMKTLAIWAVGILTFAGLDAQLSGDIQTNDYLWIAAAIVCVLARLALSAERGVVPATESPAVRQRFGMLR